MAKKQDYEQKKAQKQAEKQKDIRRQQRRLKQKKILNRVIGLGLVALIIYGLVLLASQAGPQGEDLSQAVPIMSDISHIDLDASHQPYNSNPPTSGPHYAQTAQEGFRDTPIPDENIVHNLEHGDVWISYRPDIPDKIKEKLKQFTSEPKVIITPRPANDKDIALAAWGRLDKFDLSESGQLPIQRIQDFISRYLNRGPERVPGPSGGI